LDQSSTAKKAWQTMNYVVGGTPLLIKKGKPIHQHASEKTLDSFLTERHARTALCVKKDQHILWLVISHTKEADRPYVQNILEGFTIAELTRFLQSQGCQEAINLDGGGSSTMIWQQQIANWPAGDLDKILYHYHERAVTDAILLLPRT